MLKQAVAVPPVLTQRSPQNGHWMMMVHALPDHVHPSFHLVPSLARVHPYLDHHSSHSSSPCLLPSRAALGTEARSSPWPLGSIFP